MNVENKIHPDDIADTQKMIEEAGEMLNRMYETSGVEKPQFLTTLDRIKALEQIEVSGVRIFGESFVKWLSENGFFRAPASTRYHGNYIGGLFDHSYQVGLELSNLTSKLGLQWERPMSPWVIGILHDLCKINQYEFDGIDGDDEVLFHYDDSSIIKGHGVKSLVYALNLIDLTQEEQACILYHMGAFTPEREWSNYTNAIHKYPNVLYTHTADMIASHIHMV